MIIERQKHRQFLQDELKKQTDEFRNKLESSAQDLLLDKHELYVAIFIKYMDNGEMLLKFPSSRPLPRKNEHFYCFTLPDSHRRYKEWGSLTYGDLIKKETQATEIRCVWHSSSDNPQFVLAGFKGGSEEFKNYIETTPGGVVVLGPQIPPFEYLANLEKITYSVHNKCKEILDVDYNRFAWNPILLSTDDDMSSIVMEQLALHDSIIIQGPPGTGKTFRIANLCVKLCSEGYSVLVTALTNRALMEVAEKLKDSLVKDKKVYKTNLSTDESKEVRGILSAEKMFSIPGKLMLSTFYISSGSAAKNYQGPLFDYVIVDEASQAFLTMLAAANMLGRKNLWVGDVCQMPPIVKTTKDRIRKQGYEPLIDGFDTLTVSNRFKTYQLADTYRLGKRAAEFTALFYNGNLRSMSSESYVHLNEKEGPIMVSLDMPIGDPMPANAIQKAVSIASEILLKDKKCKIAILSQLIKTTGALQVEVARQIGSINNIIVDTVARVQGLTRDATIYVIPDTDAKLYSLEKRLFNVATSRAIRNTFIICPKNIAEYTYMSAEVRHYLRKLLQNEANL